MADTKISGLAELTAPAIDDLLPILDVSDTSMAGTGTDKKVKAQTLIDQAVARALGGSAPTGITYQNFDRNLASYAATITLTAGTLKLCGIWLPAGLSVASVTFMSGTTGLTTAGTGPHAWAALFDSSRALLRQSTDDTAATWSASTLKTFNLSSAFVTTYTGLHYVGVMIDKGSTGAQPTLGGHNVVAGTLVGLAPVLAGNSSTGQGATAPNPAAAITVGSTVPYCGVA